MLGHYAFFLLIEILSCSFKDPIKCEPEHDTLIKQSKRRHDMFHFFDCNFPSRYVERVYSPMETVPMHSPTVRASRIEDVVGVDL